MDEFTIPEDLTVITDLNQAMTDAQAAADALLDIEDPTDEDLDALDALSEHIVALRAEGARRDEEAAQREERREQARARIAGDPDPADEADAEAGDAPPEDGEADAEANVERGENESAPAVQAEAPAEEAPQAVAAAAAPRRSTIPTRRPENPMPAARRTPATITAAAGIPNVEPGGSLDFQGAAAAFARKTASFPQVKTPPRNLYNRVSVATFSRNDFGGLTDTNPDFSDHQSLLDAAGDMSRYGGSMENLVAAGGWCAPSQTLYDLVEVESTDGLLDLPEVNVTRGGLRFTTGPDFADIYANVGFSQTEAQAIAGTTKTAYEVTCPTFQEVRLDAKGILVKSPILTEAAYPELVARVLRGSLVAHQHKVSVSLIAAMQTALGAAVTAPTTGSVTHSVLTAIALAAEGERNRRRLPMNTGMEAVIPHWLLVAIQSDLQNRAGMTEVVSESLVREYLTARNIRPQFVYGYSDARIVTPNCLVDFPDTAEVLIYAAGTFVKGVADIISLDTVYDTTDLQSNVYTAAFVEEGVLLAKRAPGGCRITIPVAVTGRTGAHDITTAYGVADV